MAAHTSTTATVRLASSTSETRAHTMMSSACALGSAFLFAYALLHALHVLGRDPHAVQQLSSIPLFGTVEAALFVALSLGLPGAALLANRPGILRVFATALYVAIGLFTVEILLFP